MPTNEQVRGEIGKPVDDGQNVIRAVLHHKGGENLGAGQMTDTSPEVGSNSIFNEGSVSKMRLGMLGYALDQDQNVNFSLDKNAKELFEEPAFKQYLQKEYGEEKGPKLGTFLDGLFTDESRKATLGDLLTHRSGVGDLTRDQLQVFDQKDQGLEKQYDLADLLLIDPASTKDPVARTGTKPHAQSDPKIPNSELPAGQYGAHQYSNMGYMIAGLAIKYQMGQPLHELHNQYFLHPTSGRATQSELGAKPFDNTIPQDNVDALKGAKLPQMPYYDEATKSVIDASKFNGANAAGGFRTTTSDLATFMEESFKGFPGTKEYDQREGKPNQNPYFTDGTIDQMMEEGKKFGAAGINPKNRTADYQMAGFVTTVKVPPEVDMEKFNPTPEQLTTMFQPDNIVKYGKTGEIPGSKTFADFMPREGKAEVTVYLKENVTPKIANLIETARLLMTSDDKGNSSNKLIEAEQLAGIMGISTDDFIKNIGPELQTIRSDSNPQMESKGSVAQVAPNKRAKNDDTQPVNKVPEHGATAIQLTPAELDQLKQIVQSLPVMQDTTGVAVTPSNSSPQRGGNDHLR